MQEGRNRRRSIAGFRAFLFSSFNLFLAKRQDAAIGKNDPERIDCANQTRCATIPRMRLPWLMGVLAFAALSVATHAVSIPIEIIPGRSGNGMDFEISSKRLASGDVQFTVTISPKVSFSPKDYGM
jgi:hypothetical protein